MSAAEQIKQGLQQNELLSFIQASLPSIW